LIVLQLKVVAVVRTRLFHQESRMEDLVVVALRAAPKHNRVSVEILAHMERVMVVAIILVILLGETVMAVAVEAVLARQEVMGILQ
jgi:hypothetical protein